MESGIQSSTEGHVAWREGNAPIRGGGNIGFSMFGDRSMARPLFYFHGFPGSHLEGGLIAAAASELGITVIALDRPGFGRSEYDAKRVTSEWAGTVDQVADHLGIGRFSVLGYSGGGPYVASVAAGLPDRVKVASAVAGMSEISPPGTIDAMVFQNRWLLKLGRSWPRFTAGLLAVVGRLWLLSRGVTYSWFCMILPSVDREVLRRHWVRDLMSRNLIESLRQGTEGAVHDFLLMLQPWTFDLRAISAPYHVWHGELDSYVPPEFSDGLAKRIVTSRYHREPGVGHLIIVDYARQILGAIVAEEGRLTSGVSEVV